MDIFVAKFRSHSPNRVQNNSRSTGSDRPKVPANCQTFFVGPEGVKWELGFALFWLEKWDFMHWEWIHQQKNNRKW